MADDFDSPWKDALDLYFEPALALLFAEPHAQIDWSRGNESLDKEFQQIVRDAETGRRYVDKLVRVWTLAGGECWVHIEVQTDRDAELPERMFVYNYRIRDRYNVPVASLAILADDDANWRPTEFRESQFGCEVGIKFPTVKLLDFTAHEAELEASANPFAKFLLAHLKALQTKGDPGDRHVWKLRLIRGLYERGVTAKDARELFRLIDWLMTLPQSLDERFWQDIATIQKEKQMPFVTTPERVGRRAGMREGIRTALKIRFGTVDEKLMREIEEIYEEEKLLAILKALETDARLEDIRKIWSA